MPEQKVVIIQRIAEPVFEDFVKRIKSVIRVDDETSALSAGFMLGVQHVIGELRKGLVVTS